MMWGMETNDLGALHFENSLGSGLSIDSTIVRSGSYSLKCVAVSGASGIAGPRMTHTAHGTNTFMRVYVRVTVLPTTTARAFISETTATHLRLNPSGTVAVWDPSPGLVGTSTIALTDTSRWYLIEYRKLFNTAGASVVFLRIDGADQVTSTYGTSRSISDFLGAADTVADTFTAYYDDWAEDDAAFPGHGRVVLLKPVSDNTRTNWTAGAGGTTNLWDAVDNTPPAGLASASETNTSNIESASNTGTANYIANLATYESAGVGPSDTVQGLCLLIAHGEDVGTGTKTGSYELTANPVIASTAFTFGIDGGAHAAYLNLWDITSSKFVAAPGAVTITSNPTLKVIKTDTGTRTGCVCFMGMYVDFTENRSPPFSRRHRNYIIR